jgi:hypothetical protein
MAGCDMIRPIVGCSDEPCPYIMIVFIIMITLLQSLHHSPESFRECCLGTGEVDTYKPFQGIAVHLTIVKPHTMGIEFLY